MQRRGLEKSGSCREFWSWRGGKAISREDLDGGKKDYEDR